MNLDRAKVRRNFAQCVNMTADDLEVWLQTPESSKVGWKPGGGESVGHASGRRIAALLRSESPPNDEELLFMRKVVGFVRRHSAQEPANPVTSRWRYSLMNWGHDPLL